jgi:tRNA nucleotidyltransferase (CCA-adding enzyme)
MQNKSELDKVERKSWLNWKCFTKSNLLKLAWLQHWDVDNFISFPKSPRSSKSEFGAKSYAHNTKSELLKKQEQHMGCPVHTGLSGMPNLLKLVWIQLWDVENFISFPKSTRSSKSEFRAKRYGQNTTSEHRLSGAHQTVRCAMSGAPSSEAPTDTFNS